MSGLRDAQRALGRGAVDEALVYLWNELEPTRLAGNRRGLAAIGRMAEEIAEHGDPAQQRDAARLLAEVAEAAASEPEPAAVAFEAAPASEMGMPPAVEPPRETPATAMPEPPAGPAPAEEWGEAPEPDEEPRGQRVASWLWAAIVLGVILLNILRNLLDRS